MGTFEKQTTLRHPAAFSGVGLFTGEPSSIRLLPAAANTGFVFQRADLPGKPEIPAHLDYIRQTPRCTLLSKGEASVQLVEHLLSALRGMGLDNARIEVMGPEIPAGDGSASEFVRLIQEAGVAHLDTPRNVYKIHEPIFWSEGDIHLVGLPAPDFRISYTLHYPQSPLIRSQYFSCVLTPEFYQSQLASCRTFALYEEIAPFIQKGLIKGGGLENALVIQGERVLNQGGVRFPDEMVRHKVLDLIGDLALIGTAIEGHILAVRSGHASNALFAKALLTRREAPNLHGEKIK
jgi:UDP-3-O-[3-hydroxymyristoyl] N-acetylglucosamine deacetylase